MRILALDTSLGACSVAALEILDGQEHVRGHAHRDISRGHAEVLMGLVSEVQVSAGFGALESDRLAVTTGPGTFTGLRVGLAAARGFALASGKPLVGITSLQAIAKGATGEAETIGTVLDAKRGDLYLGLYRNDDQRTPVFAPAVLPTSEVASRLIEFQESASLQLIGTGLDVLREHGAALPEEAVGAVQPDALNIAKLAGYITNPESAPPEPLYLRGPDAKPPSRNPLA